MLRYKFLFCLPKHISIAFFIMKLIFNLMFSFPRAQKIRSVSKRYNFDLNLAMCGKTIFS
jgi:hypothetical protein